MDKVQDRIDLAKSVFGATHGLNTSGVADLTAAMKEIAGGRGPTVVIESEIFRPNLLASWLTVCSATGFPLVLESAYYSLDTKGSFVQVGGPTDQKYRFNMDLVQHLFRGVKLFGCVEGDSVPGKFIPEMIGYYREGKLPGKDDWLRCFGYAR